MFGGDFGGKLSIGESISIHEASTLTSWSGLYGPVLWLILFINLAARSWKECSENLLGLPLWRYDHPGFWLRVSQELNGSLRCSGCAFIAPTAAHQTDLNGKGRGLNVPKTCTVL